MIEASKDCDNNMARSHKECTGDQDGLTSDMIDPEHGRDGRNEHTVLHMSAMTNAANSNTYAIPVIPVARSETVLPVKPKDWKMDGA